MSRIIKADLYKLFNEIYLKVMALICLLYTIIKAIPFYEILEKLSGIEFDYESQVITGHNAFLQLGFDGFFNFFIPFLIVVIFSSEFAKKTIRNIAALKIGRINIFLGKYIVFVISVFALMLFSAVTSTVLFSILNGWGGQNVIVEILDIALLVCKYSIIQISYASIVVILSLLIQNGALIIILYFGLSLVESIVSSMFQMFAQKSTVFNVLSFAFPSTYMYEFPLMKISDNTFLLSMISILTYVLLTVIIGCTIMKRKDIRV